MGENIVVRAAHKYDPHVISMLIMEFAKETAASQSRTLVSQWLHEETTETIIQFILTKDSMVAAKANGEILGVGSEVEDQCDYPNCTMQGAGLLRCFFIREEDQKVGSLLLKAIEFEAVMKGAYELHTHMHDDGLSEDFFAENGWVQNASDANTYSRLLLR